MDRQKSSHSLVHYSVAHNDQGCIAAGARSQECIEVSFEDDRNPVC